MPEMNFRVRWPNATETTHYSPSLVIEDHLSPGQSYETSDFVARCRTALGLASDRVQARFGMPCSRALAERGRIERLAEACDTGLILVVGFDRPGQDARP